jgi:protocatechuate 3,4-dioxygenase beta subunit
MIIKSRRAALRLLGATALAACAAEVDTEEQIAAAVTPSEDEGPFFPVQTNIESDADLTRLEGRSQRAAGQVIQVRGRVLARSGQPISGARVQVWQANAAGRYAHPGDAANVQPLDPNFQGYATLQTGADGAFSILTVRPGGYDVPSIGRRTPHLHWKFAGRGPELTTQSYFPGEPQNEGDALMRAMGEPARLLIVREGGAGPEGVPGFDWDIVLA